MKALTDEQKRLAGDPDHVALAMKVARQLSRKFPNAPEIRSHAMWGLCVAARTFDPTRGKAFRSWLYEKVPLVVIDCLRTELALRRPEGSPAHAGQMPVIPQTGEDVEFDSGERPVGWQAESEEHFLWLTRRLPPLHRMAVRLYFSAERPSMAEVGRHCGVTMSRVSQMLSEAVAMFWDDFGVS